MTRVLVLTILLALQYLVLAPRARQRFHGFSIENSILLFLPIAGMILAPAFDLDDELSYRISWWPGLITPVTAGVALLIITVPTALAVSLGCVVILLLTATLLLLRMVLTAKISYCVETFLPSIIYYVGWCIWL